MEIFMSQKDEVRNFDEKLLISMSIQKRSLMLFSKKMIYFFSEEMWWSECRRTSQKVAGNTSSKKISVRKSPAIEKGIEKIQLFLI
jgi:hypothetical protein